MTSDKQCHQALAAREKPKSNVCQCNNVDKKAIKTIIDLERMKTDRKTVEGRAIAPKQGMLNVENQLTAYKQSDQGTAHSSYNTEALLMHYGD